MAQWHPFKARLLAGVTALSLAGCGLLPEASNSSTAMAGSCAVQSAEVRAPNHPIVELAACIARTDDLLDPDRLFRQTLGIKKDRHYGGSDEVSRGLAIGVKEAEAIQRLPEGIRSLFFQSIAVGKSTIGGRRELAINVVPSKSCVTLADVIATFGNGYSVSPHPVVAPAPALPGVISSPLSKTGRFPGVYYVAQRLFNGPINGTVHFDFDYDECVRRIYVQRDVKRND